jgi:peptidoglycan/xylan/chitin deacetylase (PgdA/CDA1 family)
MPENTQCLFDVDIDAVGGWPGSYGGEDSPSDIRREMCSGQVGTPRLLKLFKKYDLPATWFIPGHSIETFPDSVNVIVDAGHEIGAHGHSHENPIAMPPEQEEDVLSSCVELIEKVSGPAPRGYVPPWWKTSNATPALLQKYEFPLLEAA